MNTIAGYRLGLTKKDELDAKKWLKKKPCVPQPSGRVGWKKALRKLEEMRSEQDISVSDMFIQLSGSVSRTSLDECSFVSSVCKHLGPYVISKDDAQALAKKLLAQRKTGYIIAKDLMMLLKVKEDNSSHQVFPDWLLQRQDFCEIQNNASLECNVRNLRVVSAARACQTMRNPADIKCLFNWMNLNCSFLTRHYGEKLMDFCREVEFKEYSENESIIQEGDSRNPGVYMILTGIVSVLKNGSKLSTLTADGYFGEKSLQGDLFAFHNVSVVTFVPTKVLFISRSIFKRIISNPTQYPPRQDIALFICNYCAPFRYFSFQNILDASRRILIESYNDINQVILRQNDRPSGLYIITKGVVEIVRVVSINDVLKSLDDEMLHMSNARYSPPEQHKKRKDAVVQLTLATLHRGNIIGESCLMNLRRARTSGYSAITASENVELYKLEQRECLQYILDSASEDEAKQCLSDIKLFTEMRRLSDADFVLKFEDEIRSELVQRNLRRLNLRPIRSLVVAQGYHDHTSNRQEKTHSPNPDSPYRDQYNHRLNCLGFSGIGAGRKRPTMTMIRTRKPPSQSQKIKH